MNLINQKVSHKKFGKGNIVNITEFSVEIAFGSENKKFIYPDAFGKFLKLHDDKVASKMKQIVQKKELELQQKKLKEEEEKRRLRKKHQLRLEFEKLMNNQKLHPSSQAVFWCDEEELNSVFTDWQVFTGVIKSGANEGKPRKLSRLLPNSACLITARASNEKEKDRRIVGVYMVKEDFVGKLREDGYIPAHSEYRLKLTEQESDKLLFWNYYFNERNPDKITWGSGKYRYFDNVMLAQILRDTVSLKKDSEEHELAKEFFNHFCSMNMIISEDLPEADGALLTKELNLQV